MSAVRRMMLRAARPAIVRLAWWLTTHPGFYSPCDGLCCEEVRDKARSLGSRAAGKVTA